MTQEILVEVIPPIVPIISPTASLCKGESVRLNAGGSNTYHWAPQDGLSNPLIASPSASPEITTVYTVHISEGGFCAVTTTVLVKVNPTPTVNAGENIKANIDDVIHLNAKGNGSLTWIFGEGILCHDCPNSQIMPQNSGCYIIRATNQYGCTATDEVCIELSKEFTIYVPNVFSPNSDGLNDTFLVYGIGISEISVRIFDRWGEELNYEENQTKGWDGTFKGNECKNDVYVYKVTYKALDGKKHTKTGHVTLMK